jgi:hypothetical protein
LKWSARGRHGTEHRPWLTALLARRPTKVAAIALARLRRGIDGRDRQLGPRCGTHDPDQCHRSTAAQGIRTVSCATRFLGWTLRGWVAELVYVVDHGDPNPAAASCSVIWSISPMKRGLAAFAIAASLFAPVAHANDALEAKVRAYVPVISLAKVCDIRINDATLDDHRAMLEAVKSDPNANKLAYRLHYEAQTAYIKARDGGQRLAFCKDFIAANSQYAKARVTAVVEGHMSDVNDHVRAAIAYNVCGANTSAKLSKADWKPYALIKKMLQIEHKLAKENAETNGWNVTEETTAVTEQFCAALKTR